MTVEDVIKVADDVIWRDLESPSEIKRLSKWIYYLWLEYKIARMKYAESDLAYNRERAEQEVFHKQNWESWTKSDSLAKAHAERKHWEYRIHKGTVDSIQQLSDSIKEYINAVKKKWEKENIYMDYKQEWTVNTREENPNM